MNNRAFTMSLLMAAVAVFFVYSYVEGVREEYDRRYGAKVVVVKAKADIKEQESLNETMLKFEVVPDEFLEPGAVKFNEATTEEERKKGIKPLIGAVALVPIRANEQITFNKITEPGMRTGLSPQVAPGRRAVAVPVTEISGVGKLLKPGDRVDLIAVIDAGAGKENRLARTLFQDLVVLSVGQFVTNNVPRVVDVDSYSGRERVRSLATDTSYGTVTLEVEPQQAQALALLATSSEHQIILALRNNDDTAPSGTEATTLQEILGSDAGRVPQRLPAGGLRR